MPDPANTPERWNAFYADRARPCPFFVDAPDESLLAWQDAGLLGRGRALDLGCGFGRNALFLARHGWAVDGIDLSPDAIGWALQQRAAAPPEVAARLDLRAGDLFEAPLPADAYALVVDSGCFHHLLPRQHAAYVDRVAEALAPGGTLVMTCFMPAGGSDLTEAQAEARGTTHGGLGYTARRLREIWSRRFDVQELRPMREGTPAFGKSFLWALRATLA